MSLLGDAFGFLFGGKSQKADWKQIERLMEMSAELNRTNRHGPFSNWDWTENPDGSWTQAQTLAPGLQAGADRLLNRVSGPMPGYESPAQFSSLLDAKMANQMQRHGLLDEEAMSRFSLKQDNFGDRAGDRQGGWWDQRERRADMTPFNTPPPEQTRGQPQVEPDPRNQRNRGGPDKYGPGGSYRGRGEKQWEEK